MIGKKISAETGSVAIGGDNNGQIFNLESGANLHIHSSVETERSLGSYLGTVISVIAQQRLSEYGHKYNRKVTVEVQDKLDFNQITLDDRLIQNYRKYYFLLDRAYKGVEQSNNDVRVLVRIRAGSIYNTELTSACKAENILPSKRVEYSRNNAHILIEAVKTQMIEDIKASQAMAIDPTWIDLAISLLVADAVAECDVLERAPNAIAA
jgi:hypothetical protein